MNHRSLLPVRGASDSVFAHGGGRLARKVVNVGGDFANLRSAFLDSHCHRPDSTPCSSISVTHSVSS
ncbi:MAG: hypothetical protein QM691_02360 [Opitutaceae bacterium]